MSLLGIDIGSTGTKGIAFDPEGHQLTSAYREYLEIYPGPNMIELPPQDVWSAVQEVIREIAAATQTDPIETLAISAIGESFTPVSRNGEFLYNTITSMDNRSVAQAEALRERVGEWETFRITGQPLHPSYTLTKIMWLRIKRPDLYAQTWKFLLWPDLVMWKLGLEPRLDYTLAGRTMAFDVVGKTWSATMLDAADVPAELFAEPIQSGEVVGEIPISVANELGLPRGVLLVAGGHDQQMNALGAGVVRRGLAVDGMGTVECVTVAFDEPVIKPEMLKHNYCVYPHVKPNMYSSLAFTYSSGSILRWFRDQLGTAERLEAEATGRDPYEIILSGLPSGPTRVFVIPYFAGSGTPYLDPLAKGAILGLSLSCDRKTVVKAILEGVCYELALNLSALNAAGVVIDCLRATGGGSRNADWLQIKADVTGKRVVTLNVSETGCLAGAMLGAVAKGYYASVDEACAALVQERTEFIPQEPAHTEYQALYEVYKGIWPAIRDTMHRLA
ncbi:MAG: FGGY-family carbohydrate kinase [Candidatus Zipacnadales bacterium]